MVSPRVRREQVGFLRHLVLGDQVSGTIDHHRQKVERARPKGNRRTILE
jgi:hypothetical protein